MRTFLTVLVIFLAASPLAAQGVTVRLSGDIVIPPGTVHDGSALTLNGRIQVDGTLRGDAMTMNGDVAVNGTVTGSVRTFNGDISLAPGAVVGGDVWSANGRVEMRPGARVRGRIRPSGVPPPDGPPPASRQGRVWGRDWWMGWPGLIRAAATFTFVAFIVLAAAVAALFPGPTRRIADAVHYSPGEAILAGILLWILLPPLAVLLAVSIVGIPLIAFLPFAVMLLALAGFAGVSRLLGDRILGGFQEQHAAALEAVVGAALLGVLAFIPGLGWVAIFLAVTWGTGAVLLLLLRRARGAPPGTSGVHATGPT
ncbi:MAG: hypothetical protein QN141_13115 [Armatimonadota bacterium]|nr:hypothetical protein [Armatimonadota bacterium]MDR7452168.1 hypothetical protein [Armatimonadota bacterium]MDR7468065.1 hypothetical protein [Armatimonadota bacterium]MDR7494894.1 hypothetical protein [Armatimonadota bacterium]MDR7500291.1 hypothetical protein [Armatimonadota bacterium]